MKKSSNKELKKLSRAELLELLLEQSKELEEVTRERDRYKAAYEDRRINIDNAGSIAEAALKLSGIFEAAQKAADDYLQGIKKEEPPKQEEKSEEEDSGIRFEDVPDQPTEEDASAQEPGEDEFFSDDDDEGIKFEFNSL